MVNSNNGDDDPVDDDGNSIANNSLLEDETLILPKDVILNEILTRLPVKTLIRFKSVCKLWNSTISSSKFVNSHFSYSYASAHHYILANYEQPKLTLKLFPHDEIENPNDEKNNDFIVDVLNVPKDHLLSYMLVCNGLTCFRMLYMVRNGVDDVSCCGYYSIYNRALHQYREITNPRSHHDWEHLMCWFGHVPSVDDYKIVTRFKCKGFEDFHYYVYSCKSGRWKMISDLDYIVMSAFESLRHTTTVIDDFLYWSPTNRNYFEGRWLDRIIGFNLVTEQVKEFPASLDWLSVYGGDTRFFVMNKRLSLYCYFDGCNPISDVWMLRQHGDWITWEKSFSLHHVGEFLGVLPTGKFLVTKCKTGTESYIYKVIDAANNTQEELRGGACFLHRAIGVYGGGIYAESLIWPFKTIESIE